jgi:1-acyl-sn-glycerol-3-phosphate acyltransferase
MSQQRDLASTTLTRLFGEIPAFDPADDPLDMAFVERWAPLIEALSVYFRPTCHGLENIPLDGPALLVGNHGLFGFDGFFIAEAVYRATGRVVRGLGEHMLFAVPGLREVLRKIGALDGTPGVALNFLRAGHLVNTYPGGARDALKERDSLYRLHWENSYGFVKVALRARVPVILHMGIGIDDTWRIIGRIRWTGRVLKNPRYEIPLLLGWGPVPRPVKFTYYVSEPIPLEGEPEDADDPRAVDRIHRRLWERGEAMLAEGLRRRRSLWRG